MTADINVRLHTLSNPWAARTFLVDFYGVAKLPDPLLDQLEAWAKELSLPAATRNDRSEVNRHLLETYLQAVELIPIRLGAARLGMTLEFFEGLLQSSTLFLKPTLVADGQFVRKEEIKDFHRQFSDLTNRVFSDFDNFCERLHDSIERELSQRPTQLHCKTSQHLSDSPVLYAHEFDSLTGEPVSLPYKVWLETKKPFNLAPDICSLLTFKKFKSDLQDSLFPGEAPESEEAFARLAEVRAA